MLTCVYSETLKFQSYNSVIAIVGEICCILLVDKLGRRVSLHSTSVRGDTTDNYAQWPLIVGNLMASATYVCTTAIYAEFPASVENDPAHVRITSLAPATT